jgi:hypothetical protein
VEAERQRNKRAIRAAAHEVTLEGKTEVQNRTMVNAISTPTLDAIVNETKNRRTLGTCVPSSDRSCSTRPLVE